MDIQRELDPNSMDLSMYNNKVVNQVNQNTMLFIIKYELYVILVYEYTHLELLVEIIVSTVNIVLYPYIKNTQI